MENIVDEDLSATIFRMFSQRHRPEIGAAVPYANQVLNAVMYKRSVLTRPLPNHPSPISTLGEPSNRQAGSPGLQYPLLGVLPYLVGLRPLSPFRDGVRGGAMMLFASDGEASVSVASSRSKSRFQ